MGNAGKTIQRQKLNCTASPQKNQPLFCNVVYGVFMIFEDETMQDILKSNNKYQVIYADPAWSYEDSSCRGAAAGEYTLMPLDELKKLPVPNFCEDESICFMWVTMPLLREGFELLEAWGFSYVTNAFTWIKTSEHGKPRMMLGRWTRGNAEICIMGKRGKCANWRVGKGVHSVIQAPFTKHSEKPHAVRQGIEELLGERSRIELFARRSFNGWDAWGNQVDDIDLKLTSRDFFCDKTIDMFEALEVAS